MSVGNRCFIGADSIILPGVSLADYTVVGAGSVVTHSITEPGHVIAGNPARIVCTVDEYLRKNANYLVNLDNIGRNGDLLKSYFNNHKEKMLIR